MKTSLKIMIAVTIIVILLTFLFGGMIAAIINFPTLFFKSEVLAGIASGAEFITKLVLWVIVGAILVISWIIYFIVNAHSESTKLSESSKEFIEGNNLKAEQYKKENYDRFNKPSFSPNIGNKVEIIDAEYTEVKEDSTNTTETSDIFSKVEEKNISDAEIEQFNNDVDELKHRLENDFEFKSPFQEIIQKNKSFENDIKNGGVENIIEDNRIEVDNKNIMTDERVSFNDSIYGN